MNQSCLILGRQIMDSKFIFSYDCHVHHGESRANLGDDALKNLNAALCNTSIG
jgi:hypothetical protein